MAARWDNIEILQAIDRIQRERYGGGRITTSNGMYLMDEINASQVVEDQRWRGFIQELHIARAAGLLTFKEPRQLAINPADVNPYAYLQTLTDFALTPEGQDRARGRIVIQPPPDPADDDGRRISILIIRQIAAAITAQYAADDVAELLREEGLPPEQLTLADYMTDGYAYTTLTTTWRWGSAGRRLVRRFIGRWLDDRLLTGPDPELRAVLIDQLARQGWRVRQADATLVVDDPANGIPVGASFLRASRLHPLIEAVARPQFLIGQPQQGVFTSMRAVEVRVRSLAGQSDDDIGVALMNKAFGPGGPLTDGSVPKGEQEGIRALFAGAYSVLRNPAGHRQVDYDDLAEAAEAVQTASLLMRILDRVQARLEAGAA